MAKRIRYEVLPLSKAELASIGTGGGLRWKVTIDGDRLAVHGKQAEAVTFAAATARSEWKSRGVLGELVIKGRDGRIRDSRTYGRDPRRTPG